jgi:hypothetical protein
MKISLTEGGEPVETTDLSEDDLLLALKVNRRWRSQARSDVIKFDKRIRVLETLLENRVKHQGLSPWPADWSSNEITAELEPVDLDEPKR